jgi:hypothetical protein
MAAKKQMMATIARKKCVYTCEKHNDSIIRHCAIALTNSLSFQTKGDFYWLAASTPPALLARHLKYSQLASSPQK